MLRRLLLTSALAAAFLVLAPRLAHAQAVISIYQEQSLPRADVAGKAAPKRPLQFTPEGVNYQDCVDDIRIVFPLQMSGFVGNASLQAWASLSGADCSTQQNRSSATKVCWPLLSGIPLTTTQNVSIPVRDIMSGARSSASEAGAAGTVANPDNTAAICGTVDLTTVSVEFLYFNPGDLATAAVKKVVAVQVDTIGPAAPTGMRVKPGNGRLTVEWDNISGEAGVSVLTGVKVYCDTNGAADLPNDAGACGQLMQEREAARACKTVFLTDDAGNDAGSTQDCDGGTATETASTTSSPDGGTCSSSNLGANIIPSAAFDGCFSCGTITGNTGTTVAAENLRGGRLTNNSQYALAVASTDAFNNVGPLSELICEFPEETNDFWQNYRNSGGQAGGGCATSGDTPLGSLGVLGGAAALALSVAQRARRRRTPK